MNGTDDAKHPDHAGVAFRPPVMLLACLGLGFLLRWLVPLSVPTVSRMIGPVVVAMALAIFIWAVSTMLRGRASIPTNTPTDAIVSSGPFRFSRNPIYLSMILLQIGVGVWTKSVWFFALAALSSALLTVGVIVREERYLERKFGDEYLSYKSRVRRWI